MDNSATTVRRPLTTRLALFLGRVADWLLGGVGDTPREAELRGELEAARGQARYYSDVVDELRADRARREVEVDLQRRQLEAEKEAAVAEREFLADVLERNQKWVQADTAAHVAAAELTRRRREE